MQACPYVVAVLRADYLERRSQIAVSHLNNNPEYIRKIPFQASPFFDLCA